MAVATSTNTITQEFQISKTRINNRNEKSETIDEFIEKIDERLEFLKTVINSLEESKASLLMVGKLFPEQI